MHFQISGSELLSLVSLVEKAVAPTDAVPALTGIHCAAKDDKLTLTANNLQLAIQSSAPCTVFKPGEYILDGRLFAELVRKLPSDNVVMEYKNDQVAITAATMEFFLNTIIADEFPAYPKCSEKVLAITDRELERLIRNSSFATSTDDHQPIFSGVLVEIGEEGFQFIATDSNRLAYAKAASGEAQVQNRQFIVPKANLLELNRCLPLTEEVVQVFYGDNQLAFEFDSTIFTTRLIDGKFPNYRAVLFTEQETSVIIKRRQFIEALERASLFTRVEKVPVIIQVTDGVLEIGTTSRLGKAQEQYNVEQRGKNEKAAYSPKFILDMLKTMAGEQVEFRFEGSRQALIKPEDSEDHLYILMPVRI